MSSIETVTVGSVMTRGVKTAKEGQSVKAVAKIMQDNDIGSVVIVKAEDEGRPVGIITERDLVRLIASAGNSGSQASSALGTPAREAMSKPVLTADVNSSLRDAMQTMQLKNIRRLPVVEKGRMVGIITDKDIFRAIMRSQSLVSSFLSETLVVEYRPAYERLNEFMLGEMLLPGGGNQ